MMKDENAKINIPQISKSELSKVKNNLLNQEQLALLLGPTPPDHKYTRPAKGGGTWTYVTGAYIKKVLNLMFGWNWDFEIVGHEVSIEFKQVVVKGRLTVRSGDQAIVKMQFGRQDIKMKKDGTGPLDLGNDLKGATTDALKKCASEFGIASDVYAPNEYKRIQVVDDPEARDFEHLKLLVENAKTIDELQMLWESFSEVEKDSAKDLVNLKKAEL
jgi:recombination DNA repair RAD52 pathway protein